MRPPTVIRPASGGTRPAQIHRRVVLPAPFSPVRATTSPPSTVRSAPSRTLVPPKRFETPVALSSGMSQRHVPNLSCGRRQCYGEDEVHGPRQLGPDTLIDLSGWHVARLPFGATVRRRATRWTPMGPLTGTRPQIASGRHTTYPPRDAVRRELMRLPCGLTRDAEACAPGPPRRRRTVQGYPGHRSCNHRSPSRRPGAYDPR